MNIAREIRSVLWGFIGVARRSRLDASLDWHLKFDDALSGDIHLARRDGDLTVPGDVPIQLGLEDARLDIAIRRIGGGLVAWRRHMGLRPGRPRAEHDHQRGRRPAPPHVMKEAHCRPKSRSESAGP